MIVTPSVHHEAPPRRGMLQLHAEPKALRLTMLQSLAGAASDGKSWLHNGGTVFPKQRPGEFELGHVAVSLLMWWMLVVNWRIAVDGE